MTEMHRRVIWPGGEGVDILHRTPVKPGTGGLVEKACGEARQRLSYGPE